MTEIPKEGAGRPLYESAPKITPATPVLPAAPFSRFCGALRGGGMGPAGV